MNTERILQLAQYIESLPEEKFDMSEFHVCETAVCIAGYACQLFKEDKTYDLSGWQSYSDFAACALELPRGLARELFLPSGTECGYSFLECIPKSDAVETLRNLAETGEVKWPKGRTK